MISEKPGLGQLTTMIEKMRIDKNLDMFDWSDAFSRMEPRMTMKQYRYALALWINGKNHDLKNLLLSFLNTK
jgi:hypothetical protein